MRGWRACRAGLLGVDFALMFGDFGHVPAALAARGRLFVAVVAVQRSAVEELLQARAFILRKVAVFARQGHGVAAALAIARVEIAEQGGIVVVHAATDDAAAVAQRTRHLHLRRDRLANERTLVRQLIEKLGQLFFHFEGHHRGLVRLTRHTNSFTGYYFLIPYSIRPNVASMTRPSMNPVFSDWRRPGRVPPGNRPTQCGWPGRSRHCTYRPRSP